MAAKHYLMIKLVSNPTRKPSKAKLKALEHELALARVRRPDLEAAIASGEIHALKRVPAHVVKNPALRKRDFSGAQYAYELTDADMGRAKSSPETQAMSIYQWLIKYYVAAGVFTREEIAIVIVRDDTED
jgi:hypothetical protein